MCPASASPRDVTVTPESWLVAPPSGTGASAPPPGAEESAPLLLEQAAITVKTIAWRTVRTRACIAAKYCTQLRPGAAACVLSASCHGGDGPSTDHPDVNGLYADHVTNPRRLPP